MEEVMGEATELNAVLEGFLGKLAEVKSADGKRMERKSSEFDDSQTDVLTTPTRKTRRGSITDFVMRSSKRSSELTDGSRGSGESGSLGSLTSGTTRSRSCSSSMEDGTAGVSKPEKTGFARTLRSFRSSDSACPLVSTINAPNLSGDEEEGPIVDIQLLVGSQKCPPGFKKVSVLGSGKAADFNKGLPGKSLFICYRRSSSVTISSDPQPVTAVVVLHEGKQEFVPPGFDIVGTTSASGQFMADISMGNGAYGRMFLCVCRGEGPPLCDILATSVHQRGEIPNGYGVLERTPLGFNAVLGCRHKAQNALFLCVRRDTSHFEPLARLVSTSTLSEDQRVPLLPTNPKFSNASSSFRSCITHADLRESGATPETVAAVLPMLLACYGSDLPSTILSMQGLERALRSGAPGLEVGKHGASLSLGDLIIKAAADCAESCMDVLFYPAMRLLTAALENATHGLCPISTHFVLTSTLRSQSFFRMLSLESYTSNSPFRNVDSHRFGSGVWEDEWGLQNADPEGSPGEMRGHVSTPSSSSSKEMLEQLSVLSLQDLNYVMRCPSTILDSVARLAIAAPLSSGEREKDASNETGGRETGGEEEKCGQEELASSPLRVVDEIVDELCEDAANLKESMRLIDDASKRLIRHTTASALFARDLHRSLCRRLHLNHRGQENAVMVIVWLSQRGAMPLTKPLRKGRLFNAEFNEKLACLELVKDMLISAGSSTSNKGGSCSTFFSGQTFHYLLRRFTFRAAMSSIRNPKCIESVLPILGEMWKSGRRHLKVEVATVLEQVFLFILRDPMSSPKLRRLVLENVVSWFGMHPEDLTELFLNFENDPVVREWRSFSGLIETISRLADPESYVLEASSEDARVNKEIQYDALTSLVALLRSITDMSGTHRLMDEKAEAASEAPDAGHAVRARQDARGEHDKIFRSAFVLSRTKDVRKAVDLLAGKGLLEKTPSCIASFLHQYHLQLDPRQVGAYLGSKAEDSFMNQVRMQFTRALPFSGKTFEQCLRLFLEKGHFFLPGEAQQVEALLEAFAACYVDENRDEFSAEEDKDMIMVLSFSTVMLNTDLHNPAVHKKKKMTEEQFLRQISCIENGSRISDEFGRSLYRSIAESEIKMSTATTSAIGNGKDDGAQASENGSSGENALNGAALAALNSSHAPAQRLARATSSGETLTRARADRLFAEGLLESVDAAHTTVSSRMMHWLPYHSKVTLEAVKVMFEVSWMHFYQLATKILESPKLFNLDAVSCAMDILSHSISIALFLGMEVERKAFAMLLAKFHYLYTNNGQEEDKDQELSRSVGIVKGEHLKDKWYENVMNATCESTNIIEVINEVHHLTASMKERIAQRNDFEQMLAVQKRFEGGVAIMEPGRKLVREGDLLKRMSNKKHRKYRFFLFNDLLIYASQRSLTSTKYHVHQMLPLQTMQVREARGTFAFEVRHPRKSFVVQAFSEQEKFVWMRDIMRHVESFYSQLTAGENNKPVKKILRPASSSHSASLSSFSSGSSSQEVDNQEIRQHGRPKTMRLSTSSSITSDESDGIVDPKVFACDDLYDDEDEDGEMVEDDASAPTTTTTTMASGDGDKKEDDSLSVDDPSSQSIAYPVKAAAAAASIPVMPPGPPLRNSPDTLKTESSGRKNEENKLEWLTTLHLKMGDVDLDAKARELDAKQLARYFLKALKFSKPILKNCHAKFQASDEDKLLMYAFFKQATKGDANGEEAPDVSEWTAFSKFKVWESLAGLSKDKAKMQFLTLLSSVAPGWNDMPVIAA